MSPKARCETIALLLLWSVVAGAAPPPPASAFLGGPAFVAPVFSPDGERIACLVRQGDRLMVAVRPTGGGALQTLASIAEPDVIPRWLKWTTASRLFVNVDIADARVPTRSARAHRVIAIDLQPGGAGGVETGDGGSGTRAEWDVPWQDEIFYWQRNDPMHALVQYRDPGQPYPSVKAVEVESGKLTSLVPSHPGVEYWLADHDGEVRAGVGLAGERYRLFARASTEAEFEKIEDFAVRQASGPTFAGFGFDPTTLYVWKSLDGRRALYAYDLSARQVVRLVFAHPAVDVDGLVFNQGRRELIAVDYIDDGPQRHFLDSDAERDQVTIDRALPGTFNEVVSQNKDHTRAIVRAGSDTRPPAYYLFDRARKPARAELLQSFYPELANVDLAPMRSVSYRGRDGLNIPAYLTIPPGAEPRNLPVIIHPHGGPGVRDFRQFDPEVQFLASRGFAVFQMNFRGSGGYGEAYRERGFRQWGQAMQDDVTDGVRWLIAQGIADPDRIGIYGASYGGYAALMGLVKTPELYRAGAAYAAATNLPAFVAANPRMFAEHERGGTTRAWTDTTTQQANSPYHNASRIMAPVLLAHGADDDRVPVVHARTMAQALRAAGKDVEYLEFAHEPHGFLAAADRVRFYERLAGFFEIHLAAPTVSRTPER
ncbi:MAG: S9 family peptidase [Candidatus Binatia bacterium]